MAYLELLTSVLDKLRKFKESVKDKEIVPYLAKCDQTKRFFLDEGTLKERYIL